MATTQALIARLIAAGLSVSVRPHREQARPTDAAPLFLHIRAGQRLTAELAAAAPGHVRQLADSLGVVRRYQEIAAWLLAHPDPPIAKRLAVMVPQVAELVDARRLAGQAGAAALPVLRYRPGRAAPGCCLACGDPLGPSDDLSGLRCRPCRVATQLALVRVLEGVPAYAAPTVDAGGTGSDDGAAGA